MKWFSLPTALIILAISAQAHADLSGRLVRQDAEISPPVVMGIGSSAEADAEVVDQTPVSVSAYSGYSGGSVYGYPFVSGCCEQRSSCCDHLWHGYRGHRHGCGCLGWYDHCAPRCHKAPCPYGCGPYPYRGCKSLHRRPFGHRLGLWDWRRGHGGCHRCGKAYYPSPCGGCGCGSSYGYGGGMIIDQGEVVDDSHVVPEPAPVPGPSSDNSARSESPRRWRLLPANFLRRGVEADDEL